VRPKFKLNKRFDAHQDKGSLLFKPAPIEGSQPELTPALKAYVVAAAKRKASAALTDGTAASEGASPGNEPEPLHEESIMMNAVNEYVVFEVGCRFIAPLLNLEGNMKLTNVAMYFTPNVTGKKRRWAVAAVKEIHLRRYLLHNCAMEIFFTHNRTIFVSFVGTRERDVFFQKLIRLRPPFLEFRERNTPEAVFKGAKAVTDMWVNHQISNMDYLMYLNTIAGRTYSDLGQYPVFPWVLSCYGEDHLNLDDPSCYRDLSKPMGAQTPDRLQMFQERFRSFVDPEIPAFMYGSHYSNAGIVLYYLVRMEPYTSYHIALQGGKFDQADRMFHRSVLTIFLVFSNP
jgi:hypothetical protein